jgi:carbon-monoxide dehydrogenase medium subunit
MKPARFEIHRPREIAEALDLLARHGESAKILAGGQSLVPLMNLRMASPAVVIDINRVAGLSGIRTSDGVIAIGAMTRQKLLLEDEAIARHAPLLARAMAHVGHVQTRSRGTVGGSLAHADPAAELPLAMVTLDAVLRIRSVRGTRAVPARGFFRDALTTTLEPDELLTEIELPVAPAGARVAFREYARRHGDFAIAAAAVQRAGDDARIAAGLGGVGVVPHLCAGLAEVAHSARRGRAELELLIGEQLKGIAPLSDHHASADYRRRLGVLALADCLEEVMQ